MSIPSSVRKQIEKELDRPVSKVQRVSGGSINEAARLEAASLGPAFLKWNRSADPDMFTKEVRGLELLDKAGSGLRLPEVILCGKTPDGTGFLLLEYIEPGRGNSRSPVAFGERLARLHANKSDRFGLDHHNYIGRLPQSNKRHRNWTDFFIEERMEPQLEMALKNSRLKTSVTRHFKSMYDELPSIFPESAPCLLHGDLWGGNFFYDSGGDAVVYDPAVYYGHPEIELAFTHLFGGFPSRFYDAYEEVNPPEPGFEQRKDLYNLYPLLVHTNLFGGNYARQVESIVQRFG